MRMTLFVKIDGTVMEKSSEANFMTLRPSKPSWNNFPNWLIDLNLVSTAIQRLHLSEFELYFKFASAFMSPDTFSSTEPRQGKYKRRKLHKDNKTDKTFTFNTIPSPPSSFGSSFPSCQLPSELLLLPVVMDEDECRPPVQLAMLFSIILFLHETKVPDFSDHPVVDED